ncbi:MAG: hypothetical protein HYU60_00320 [Magnetospirillum sp.]|nr:hypothetical protein [Magnetospirillum sp.]
MSNPKGDGVFATALAIVLKHEGGFVNDAADPGGATNFGVSLRTVAKLDANGDGRLDFDFDGDGDVDADDIRAMTPEAAAAYYRSQWWDKHGYAAIAAPEIAIKVFDLAVNMGSAQAHKVLQRAVRAAWFALPDDGVLGPQTISSVNAAEPRSLLAALKSEASGFYRTIAAAKPNLAKFLPGWLNRAYA